MIIQQLCDQRVVLVNQVGLQTCKISFNLILFEKFPLLTHLGPTIWTPIQDLEKFTIFCIIHVSHFLNLNR